LSMHRGAHIAHPMTRKPVSVGTACSPILLSSAVIIRAGSLTSIARSSGIGLRAGSLRRRLSRRPKFCPGSVLAILPSPSPGARHEQEEIRRREDRRPFRGVAQGNDEVGSLESYVARCSSALCRVEVPLQQQAAQQRPAVPLAAGGNARGWFEL